MEKDIFNARTPDDLEKLRNRLTFDNLRQANALRQAENKGEESTWGLTDWSNALAGEAGEVCGFTKKAKRQLPGDPALDDIKHNIALELADVVIYADILASKIGISLGEAVREKFNIVSERRESNVRL